MSIMIDLPPAMAQEAQEYATVQGTTLERMLFDCIVRDIEKKREAKRVMAEFDDLVRKTSSRRTEPYVFCRADAYAETEANGCDEILTEDLNDGQVYCGVMARNPFK